MTRPISRKAREKLREQLEQLAKQAQGMNLAQVRRELREEIQMYVDSYARLDGVIDAPDNIFWTIKCLFKALELLPAPKKGKSL